MDREKVKNKLIKHVVDTTALNTTANPLLGALEVTLFQMTDDNSLDARLFATKMGYLGMGSVFSWGRDISRNYFNVVDESSEKTKKPHDAGYAIAFNSVFAPAMYWGEPDTAKFAVGVGTVMALSSFLGMVGGYSIDVFRDLTGLWESQRVPDLIRHQKPNAKKGLAGFLAAASVALVAGIYGMTPSAFGEKDYSDNLPEVTQNISYERSP
jgi:hypothetical protein